ncbi:MAG: NapC/NirT family cytochrome c [bacterium]
MKCIKTFLFRFRIYIIIGCTGLLAGLVVSIVIAHGVVGTSEESYCGTCHTMAPMVAAYKDNSHGGNNPVGFRAKCADCHLPHDSMIKYLTAKALTGANDMFAEIFYDKTKIDWERKRFHREAYVYDSGCLKCHKDFEKVSMKNPKIFTAHRPYILGTVKDRCVTCHPYTGHSNLKEHLDYYKVKLVNKHLIAEE